MIDLQILKDVDDIDHLTLEKQEESARQDSYHFILRRKRSFSAQEGVRLLRHLETWYPEAAGILRDTDLTDGEAVYRSLRAARALLLELQERCVFPNRH